MSNIWITSDTHFGHANITGASVSRWKSGYRTFETTHEMNKTLIDTINKYVAEDDILYFLGDWCFGGHHKTPVYRNLINCKTIHFIRGNHDGKVDLYKECFTSLENVVKFEYKGLHFYLTHYPSDNWYGKDYGTIHLFGHVHNTVPGVGKSLDIGVDSAYAMFGEYRPFNIDEIIKIMETK
jgi:calcineurin-like phosphoesterase family protein